MDLALKEIEIGTNFSFTGMEFKKTGMSWSATSQQILAHDGYRVLAEFKESKPCLSAIPKLGGEYQSNIRYYIPENTIVSIY